MSAAFFGQGQGSGLSQNRFSYTAFMEGLRCACGGTLVELQCACCCQSIVSRHKMRVLKERRWNSDVREFSMDDLSVRKCCVVVCVSVTLELWREAAMIIVMIMVMRFSFIVVLTQESSGQLGKMMMMMMMMMAQQSYRQLEAARKNYRKE